MPSPAPHRDRQRARHAALGRAAGQAPAAAYARISCAMRAHTKHRARGAGRRAWLLAGVVVLAIGAAAQATYGPLAARRLPPALRPALEWACAPLGCTVAPGATSMPCASTARSCRSRKKAAIPMCSASPCATGTRHHRSARHRTGDDGPAGPAPAAARAAARRISPRHNAPSPSTACGPAPSCRFGYDSVRSRRRPTTACCFSIPEFCRPAARRPARAGGPRIHTGAKHEQRDPRR